MTNKTVIDAIEAELRNARAALSNAGRYLDMLEDAMDAMVKAESGEYVIPLEFDDNDETIVYGLKIKCLNIKLERDLLPI